MSILTGRPCRIFGHELDMDCLAPSWARSLGQSGRSTDALRGHTARATFMTSGYDMRPCSGPGTARRPLRLATRTSTTSAKSLKGARRMQKDVQIRLHARISAGRHASEAKRVKRATHGKQAEQATEAGIKYALPFLLLSSQQICRYRSRQACTQTLRHGAVPWHPNSCLNNP